jgi:hypothetical protein
MVGMIRHTVGVLSLEKVWVTSAGSCVFIVKYRRITGHVNTVRKAPRE